MWKTLFSIPILYADAHTIPAQTGSRNLSKHAIGVPDAYTSNDQWRKRRQSYSSTQNVRVFLLILCSSFICPLSAAMLLAPSLHSCSLTHPLTYVHLEIPSLFCCAIRFPYLSSNGFFETQRNAAKRVFFSLSLVFPMRVILYYASLILFGMLTTITTTNDSLNALWNL